MMKRIHAKQKPPKIKISVFDGTSRKTKYVRMNPVLSEDVKKEKKDSVLSYDEPPAQVIFPSQIQDEQQIKPSYSEKRKKVIDAWNNIRPILLSTRIEEMSPSTNSCSFCSSVEEGIIYCMDCGPLSYYCQQCCTRIHNNILFHRPQQWKTTMYVPFLLTNSVKRIDHVCDTVYTTSVYAVDVKGLQHTCIVSLCRCEDPAITLLRYNLWAATPSSPKIVFDLRFMEMISVLQLECHLPAKTFCDALEAMHSNYIRLRSPSEKNIYRAVVGDCLTEYNYHRSCLNTMETITELSFGTECPICRKDPPIISMDANFGLVHKRSSGSGHGRSSSRHKNLFFVDHENLNKFIDDYALDKRPMNSDCSNFQAGSVVRSKVKNEKLDVTGIFGSVCKHDIPMLFADMAHGERLCYPVYLLECVLENCHDGLVVMYDIACMLHKHLMKNNSTSILERCSFAVPVFHSFAHNTECQLTYGQRFADATGLTDGEGIERLWSYLRGFKRISKEMSLNNRQDLLSEALLHHTEKQIWNIGNRLADKLKRCIKICADTTQNIKEILDITGDTEDSIDAWFLHWKAEKRKDLIKGQALTIDEQHAECLEQIEKQRQQLESVNTDQERKDIEQNIDRLRLSCTRLEKKSNFPQMQLASEQGQFLLHSAKNKRTTTSLIKLKELATDRQYLSSLMKKYAEGQAIGVRISKQFASNLQKLKKEVDNYNNCVDEKKDFKLFLSPSSDIYSQLETVKLTENQQKAVQAKFLYKHAEEEQQNIIKEVFAFLRYLNELSVSINNLMEDLIKKEHSKYNFGMLQYLSLKHFNLESLFKNCYSCFEDILTDVQVLPSIIHEKLTNELSTCSNTPTNEEIDQILLEIESFESTQPPVHPVHDNDSETRGKEDSVGDDDEEEEEDDDDDDDDILQ